MCEDLVTYVNITMHVYVLTVHSKLMITMQCLLPTCVASYAMNWIYK